MPSNPNSGDPVQPSRNIAARAGRWSAQHRKTAIIGWILFVVVAYMAGGKIGTQNLTAQESGVGDSGHAAQIVDKAFPKSIHESVMVASPTMTSGAPRFRAAVGDVVSRLEKTSGVSEIVDPYAPKGGSISADGHTALVSFEIKGDIDDDATTVKSDAAIAAVKAAAAANTDLRIEQFGDASSGKEFDEIVQGDLQKAELTSLPLTLVILLIAFGSLLAAGLPVLLAITAVLATFGLIGPISQIAAVDSSIENVVLLIGLAVGVDYSLFYLRRVREERAAGRDNDAAIEAAAATSGRAVLVSGVTVMIAMAGMYFGGASTFTSFATGTMAVVAVAIASATASCGSRPRASALR
jgi:RND superfamily putative drug exporter